MRAGGSAISGDGEAAAPPTVGAGARGAAVVYAATNGPQPRDGPRPAW